MPGRRSRTKGKVGERELAKLLSQLFDADVRRGVQYQGGPESPDVVGLQGLHIECKRAEKLYLDPAMRQAIDDSGTDIPCVCHRKNNGKWFFICHLEDLPDIVKLLKEREHED